MPLFHRFKGSGKSTLVSRLAKTVAPHSNILGFITEDVKQPYGRSRLGFDIVSITDPNQRLPLARLATDDISRLPKVGRYAVTVGQFETLALPCLQVS